MPDLDPETLLGAYATGTLTAAERKLLFEAALRNQALFNALVGEQSLKDLLDNPADRRRLLTMLEGADHGEEEAAAEKSKGWGTRVSEWVHLPSTIRTPRPSPTSASGGKVSPIPPPAPSRSSYIMLAGSLAVAVIAMLVVVELYEENAPPPQISRSNVRRQAEAPPESASSAPLASAPAEPAPPASEKRETSSKAQSGTTSSANQAPGPPSNPGSQNVQRVPSARDAFYAAVESAARPDAPGLEQGTFGEQAQPRLLGKTDSRNSPTAERSRGGGSLGMRYSLVKAGADGRDAEVNSSALMAGENTHLVIESNRSAYLYVLKRIPGGMWSILYPPVQPDTGNPEAFIEGRVRYAIPPTSSLVGSEERGPAQLFIILAQAPQAELDGILRDERGLIRHDPSVAARISNLVQRIRTELAGGRLQVQRIDASSPDRPDEHAVYVVDQAPSPHSRLLAEIMLTNH